jgi:RNA polymerase sigma-70 factor (ECF subfamily)
MIRPDPPSQTPAAPALPEGGETLASSTAPAADAGGPPEGEPTDEELVGRVRAGERHLFELIMRRHNRRIFRAARAIVRDDDEAEDVMQDAYVRAYEHLGEFEGRARLSTWLTKIAVYEALARARRGRRQEPLDTLADEPPAMPTQPTPGPEERAIDAETRRLLEGAIDELPEDFRVVFVLRAVEEMSGAEAAECLGIPEETVKTRLFRARGRLQESLLRRLKPAARAAFPFHLSRCDRVVEAVLRRIGAAR